jgi:predicted anti-sigma-YlaC factor YlaD
MTCADAERVIVRYADDERSLAGSARVELTAHLEGCAACRAALDAQRDVATALRRRPPSVPAPGLVARVSARLDAERDAGWLGLANWRAWTVGLAPVAAALTIAAYVEWGSAINAPATAPAATPTIEEWTVADAPAILQTSASGDALIEAVLTGAVPASGDGNVQ